MCDSGNFFRRHYYFTVTALPPLMLGEKPVMPFLEFLAMLELNVSHGDLEQVKSLLAPIDLYNIKAFWLGLPLDERGTVSARDLEEKLSVRQDLPPYLEEFLDRFESFSDRLRHFAFLFAALHRQERKGFLEKYFTLEREIGLVLVALRAKWTGRDLVREMQFEDVHDPIVAHIIAQRDAETYTPPTEYAEIKNFFEEHYREPRRLAFDLLQVRFRTIEALVEQEHFTLDAILGYAAQLLIVESWARLDRDKGVLAMEEVLRYG